MDILPQGYKLLLTPYIDFINIFFYLEYCALPRHESWGKSSPTIFHPFFSTAVNLGAQGTGMPGLLIVFKNNNCVFLIILNYFLRFVFNSHFFLDFFFVTSSSYGRV